MRVEPGFKFDLSPVASASIQANPRHPLHPPFPNHPHSIPLVFSPEVDLCVMAAPGNRMRKHSDWIRNCTMALFFVATAIGPEMLLTRLFPYPFLFLFFGAVVASAWFGGMMAGLCAVVFSILAVDYFFIPPVASFVINAAAAAYLTAFVVCALVASWVSSAKKNTEQDLRDARDQLEARVQERTAALMKTQAELTHLSRAMSMGELTASIAHEMKQPLTALVAHGYACLEWLSAEPPNLPKARHTAERIIQEGTRAGSVLSRIRALFRKDNPSKEFLDVNELIQDLMSLLRDEARRRGISVHTDLAAHLPRIEVDRVQLQQVVLNLVINGMDAIDDAKGSGKDLTIRSKKSSENEILVQVEDTGVGLDSEAAGKIFDTFFTTKAQGIGMGLSISRSIVESHDGRLWATARPGGGTIFQFTLPVDTRNSNG
jgi:signal transduction histidine kinase